ncbi:acyl-CoA dehydrogenase [Klebsiella variicola]|uniref:Acyl-CoA dehydrogenase n=1 Tax=Klebsiella variicola TaxID=244366 RepID=A0A7H4MKE9_KLEVA|nr:acyl-CoA dehydrogenase [Klebsiella variicola]
MKRVAIVGVGPTGIYTFYELVKRGEPLADHPVLKKRRRPGWVCPTVTIIRRRKCWLTSPALRSPPIDLTYLQWLQQHSDAWLAARGLERHTLHERQFLPRVILGEYYRDPFSVSHRAGPGRRLHR